jgi:hypothetical protein
MKKLCLWSVGLLFFIWVPSASSETESTLTVSESAVATAVENLAPQGMAENFDADVGKLYAFTRITGANDETYVKHLWFREDTLVAEVELPVRSMSWRTYSSKIVTPDMTGQWRVDITSEDGTLLKSLTFTIE